jgi:uncharacterized membrane protein YkoI
MNKLLTITSALLISATVALPFHTAQADDDYIEARRLQESGDILPLETILKKVRLMYPGKVLEIELEMEADQIVYEVEILGKDGVVREVYINAKNGTLLSNKWDD